MLSMTDVIYYQPQHEDGSMPEGLASNQVFISEQDAVDWLSWLDEEGNEDIEIREYCNDDLADVEVLDAYGNPLRKIETFSDEEIAEMITDEVLLYAGSIDNLHATRQSDETEDQFKDRVYGEAIDLINDAITVIEEDQEYDFTSFGGNPAFEWYDKALHLAVQTVMGWMLENYPY